LLNEGRESVRYDYILIAVTLLLTLLGLVILYSASYLFALNQEDRFKNGWVPLKSNIAVCIMMFVLFPVFALTSLDYLKKGWMIILLVVLTAAFNILPFIPQFQPSPKGNVTMRWVDLGITSFQPSELIKIVLPLYLAYILEKNQDRLNTFVYGPLPPLIVTILFCTLVLFQRNFSDTVLITITSLAICFVAGIRLRWFILALAVFIPVGYKLTFGDKGGMWYQRIEAFFTHAEAPSGLKRQIDFSVEAVQAGGFWGKGIGQGTLKTTIPEVHGDFVFASFAEEFGFLGVLLYIALIGVFGFICYMVAWRSRNRFCQVLAFGLVTPVIIQTLMNIAVVARAVPTTGIPLPFVSSGGSSLLVTLIGAALLVNITRRHILSLDARGQNVR
jgi:cell division protein FtsW